MNYKVLYRKYRPDDFNNIIGQDYIIQTLKNSIINKNISHAYIFSGPRGTGKTSTAKVFSKAINCLNPRDGSPCGSCEFCLNFQDNPDIIEIDAASNNGVDEIRNLIDNIKLTPTNGKYKVYIIDEVHMLTTSAFNALLLTLEEPPKHAVFILATTNIENVPITILSRCQRYDFQKIKIQDIVKRLKNICDIEKIEIDEEALTEIAYLSEGGMRDALSLLDQLSKASENITLDMVEKQIKTVSNKTINDVFQTLEDNNVDEFVNLINEFRIRAVDYKSLIKRMIENASNKAKDIKKNGRYNRLNFNDYKSVVLTLSDCLTRININVDPFTIMEMELLELFDVNEKSLYKTKKIEESVVENTNNDIVDISRKTIDKSLDDMENLIKIRINNCFVGAQKQYLEEMKQVLDEFKASSMISGKVKSTILDTNLVAASNDYLILTTDNEASSELANKLITDIENELNKYISKSLKIIFISSKRWDEEKQKYIANLKNNIKYEFITEESEKVEEQFVISDVFDMNKVEII